MDKLIFRQLNAIVSCLMVCLLSACGGSSSTVNPVCGTQVSPTIPNSRVIAFGDAQSDVGQQANKRYTVNDGLGNQTVAEHLANLCGFTSMGPVRAGPLNGQAAYSFAEGNALINSATDAIGGSVASVRAQVANFLASDTPNQHDLFIITAGTNDIILNARGYFNSTLTSQTAIGNVKNAADDLIRFAIKPLTDRGAKHVVVITPGNLARTPWGRSLGANYPTFSTNYQFLERLSVLTQGDQSCTSFACQLADKLVENFPASVYLDKRPVLLADIGGFYNLMTGTLSTGNQVTYTTYAPGATNPDQAVCNTLADANTQIGLGFGAGQVSSLNCNTSTIGNNSSGTTWDYKTSLFADDIHLTPFGNQLVASRVYNVNFFAAAWR